MELQVLLGEKDSQTQKSLINRLGFSQQAASNRLREMGKIQRTDRWIPHELNNWKSAKTHVIFCSLGTKGSRFCILYDDRK